MNILIIDAEDCALPVATRMMEAGHAVLTYMKGNDLIGKGMIRRVKDWRPHMNWADLIVLTTNQAYQRDLEPFFKRGLPIFGANKEVAELELDRAKGQELLDECGVDTLAFREFSDFDAAIRYVKRTGGTYVVKPWGGTSDKALSYVSCSPADMVFKLERWKREGKVKGDFTLQERIDGVEMAVGGWFGPGGFNRWYNENWEEKRLMPSGLGPNTGEMGTIMRYTKTSKLAKEVLEPVADHLASLGYVGYCDVNCIIDPEGTPWPLEFTMRFGWPHFHICMNLHKGDPAEWMLNLINGQDTLRCDPGVAVGVVLAHGDFPHGKQPFEEVAGYPISMPSRNPDLVHLITAYRGPAPAMVDGEVKEVPQYLTASDYVALTVGIDETVRGAARGAYGLADKVNWPNNRFYRDDIGDRLKGDLPELQKHGYAMGIIY